MKALHREKITRMRSTILIIFCLAAIAIISGYEINAEEEALTDIIQLLNDRSGDEIGPVYKKGSKH